MAEFISTFVVQETLKRIVKVAAREVSVAWGLEDELSKLTKWLLDAEAILRDVDREKLCNESVRRWVDDLQDIVGEAEDLLDEFAYEDLRRRVETKVCNLTFSFTINPLVRHDMAKKMKEITQVLKEQYRNSAPLGLVGKESIEKENEGNLRQIRETTSILNFDVVGREAEVLDVLKLVIDSSSNERPLSIIPIVGMGGVGKTTLAKLIFHHESTKKHFHETIWVCVSERFKIDEILVAILEGLTDKVPTKRESLLRKLRQELLDKRYLLVLDDVWNENSQLWEELEGCLKEIVGQFGSTIMVTTRMDEVANLVGTVASYRLEKLPEDQCWSLFKRSANANGAEITPKLEVIRKELLKKIGGIPLVAKVLGGAVEFQGDIDRWETTLESVVRKIPTKQKSFVLSILQLSVDRLPFLEKQCFAYCSNFPKDYEIVKENLIRMWIAQEFIQPQEERENITMEDLGEGYFNFLLSRSLFQDVIKDKYGRITHFKMHDLLHDVALAISPNHQKLVLDPTDWNGKSAKKLRTLIFNNQEIHEKFADCVCLRVLVVNHLRINDLPDLIGKLKYLRYLEISLCPMWVLPNSIATLYNLQTLKLGSIESLPKNLRKLVSLRHLEFHNCYSTRQMPSHMRELIHLQTLSGFVAGFEKGCKIEELGHLKNLKGQLQLLNLEQVKSKEEATDAKLVEKKNLCELTFEWSVEFLRECSNHNDVEVLEGLQPHKNTRSLKITNFGGNFLPNPTFVENLMFLCLYACTKCEKLPMLGQLPNLKELGICFMDSVRSIGSEFYGNDSNQRDYFPKLKKFDLGWMCNLEKWEEVANNESNHFGSLQTLKIDRCGKLKKLPYGLECCNSVHDVVISNCPNLALNVENMHNLSLLLVDGLKKLPKGLAHLPNLKTMMITGGMQDYDYSPFLHLPSLTKLYLNDGQRNATQLPQQLQHLTALKILAIENFHGIEALPEWLRKLTCLETLDLVRCKNLKQLPSREAMLCLTKLKDLKAMGCSLLSLGQSDLEGAKLFLSPAYCVHVFRSRESPLFKISSI